MDKVTTIRVRKSTKDRLNSLGGKGDSYDDILRKLLDDFDRFNNQINNYDDNSMFLKEGTFMSSHMILNAYNNIKRCDLVDVDGYEYVDSILNDLRFAYENGKEDYLMNLLTFPALKEIIMISRDYDILDDDCFVGDYEKI